MIPETDPKADFETLLKPGDPGYPTKVLMEMEVARRKIQSIILDDHNTVLRYFKKLSEVFEWLAQHQVLKIKLCGDQKEWEIDLKPILNEEKKHHG